MDKVSYVLTVRSGQDSLETCFCKKYLPGAWKDNLPLYDFGCNNTFWNQIAFKPITAGSVRDENINFGSDRTSLMPEKIQVNQSLRSSKFSSSHQIPNYENNTTSKLNEYINKYKIKLTLLYFNSFWQLFHIPSLISVCFCCYEKLFQLLYKKLLKSRNNWHCGYVKIDANPTILVSHDFWRQIFAHALSYLHYC